MLLASFTCNVFAKNASITSCIPGGMAAENMVLHRNRNWAMCSAPEPSISDTSTCREQIHWKHVSIAPGKAAAADDGPAVVFDADAGHIANAFVQTL